MNALTMTRNDRAFNAVVQPLFDDQGREIAPQLGRRVVRDDTGETIALCGPHFKPVQHRDVVDPILDQLVAQGYDVRERAHERRSLYDLAGQKGAFISYGFTDNGAVMRTDIITGDFIQPTGRTSYLDQGPDTMLFKTSILNSHNGSLAVKVITSYERLICMNGTTRPDFSAGVYGKHTSNLNLQAMQAKIENALTGMHTDADRFGAWAKKRITVEVAETVLRLTIAKLPPKPNGEPHFSEPLVNKILDQFRHEDQTVWGLFNAVTHWQTHGQRQKNADPLTVTIGREQRVAEMLRSAEWKKLAKV